MASILAVGASSPLSQAALVKLATRGYDLCLTATTLERAQLAKNNLIHAGVNAAQLSCCDLKLPASTATLQELINSLPDFAGLFCAAGVYGLTLQVKKSLAVEEQIIAVNFSALVPLLRLSANCLQARGQGLIIVIGSVAGDRGRASNYAYGAAKAALATYLTGLRQELYPHVKVIELRPGLIASRMLDGRHLPHWLISAPSCVGTALERALTYHQGIVYCPPWWRLIMAVVKIIPERCYRRLKL